jgi:hypothetical protein
MSPNTSTGSDTPFTGRRICMMGGNETPIATPPNDAPIDFVALAQSHKTNEQKMLDCLQEIRDTLKEAVALIQVDTSSDVIVPAAVSTPQTAPSTPSQPKMFVPKARGKR